MTHCYATEAELITRIKQGESTAMKELYDRHIGYLTAVASRYVDDTLLRDVLQDGFVKIFSSISRFESRGEGALRGWMVRIVVNVALDHLKQKVKSIPLESLPDIREEEEDPPTDNIAIEQIHALIRQLPTGYRTIFNLYVFEQLGHREIAERLGITESTSASQLHRAKALLARMIKEYNSQKTTTL
jgi:RNA polymerase sigma-70 factor (ECF subfamily)